MPVIRGQLRGPLNNAAAHRRARHAWRRKKPRRSGETDHEYVVRHNAPIPTGQTLARYHRKRSAVWADPGGTRSAFASGRPYCPRRKAITHDGLPFGVVSLDGKGTALPAVDDRYAQRQTQESGKVVGLVRTITAALTSCRACPVIDVTSLPADTNEVGWFQSALKHLRQAYGRSDWFRLVTYDAGATSLRNANAVCKYGLHYLFGLKNTQPSLRREAERLLGGKSEAQCDGETVEGDGSTRRVFIATLAPGLCDWQHLRTFLRVSYTHTNKLGEQQTETRYFLSSLPASRLKPAQWLLVIRRHWSVEIVHQTLDVAFQEDNKPWIKSNPRSAAVVMVLRRIAYTLLSFIRSVTFRSEAQRYRPWKDLLEQFYITLNATTDADLVGLRRHAIAAPPT